MKTVESRFSTQVQGGLSAIKKELSQFIQDERGQQIPEWTTLTVGLGLFIGGHVLDFIDESSQNDILKHYPPDVSFGQINVKNAVKLQNLASKRAIEQIASSLGAGLLLLAVVDGIGLGIRSIKERVRTHKDKAGNNA